MFKIMNEKYMCNRYVNISWANNLTVHSAHETEKQLEHEVLAIDICLVRVHDYYK